MESEINHFLTVFAAFPNSEGAKDWTSLALLDLIFLSLFFELLRYRRCYRRCRVVPGRVGLRGIESGLRGPEVGLRGFGVGLRSFGAGLRKTLVATPEKSEKDDPPKKYQFCITCILKINDFWSIVGGSRAREQILAA